MYKDFDRVYTLVDINEKVKSGAKGVILMLLDKTDQVYEVEFFDENHETIDVTEVEGYQIEKIGS
ncbi:DUF4926 domain-containing protein [Listeria seeligeri]|uniref:DUF4926 domain-containing protein n=1 Tax=Listeria seeligeri TaxID=1640 RepID=UPI00162847F5|nr:DUF4926 domain-containing protein [Listeria seeligeri]MBC1723784.1 DUF4926 domain-containing protein [Listeria seeligeri]MBF2437648.1 DUF4926 domain-containing protein [Listeria seeligeri]